jgi:PAS domain S-box-containing protein
VLQAVCESLGWRCGVFWMVDRATRMLSCVNLWSERPFPEFERMSREVAFSPGAGLPGRVWAKGEPVWIRDVTQDANFPRRYVAASDGLHSAVAFPVRLHDETLGVMEFYSDETLAPDDDALAVMAGIGSQLGQFIERWRAEDALRESERRLRRHNEALLSLATTAVAAQGVVAENLGRITETASRTLETDRVGVWFFNETRSAIRCADLYESREHRHSSGAELKAADYPRYFKALEEERSLAAADARTDPRTSEFREGYLAPLGISSMLDAPIRVNGVLAGVVCHEHVGAARDWTPEEQQFAASIADLVALMIEARERRRADEALLEAKDFAESVIETSNVVIVQLDAEGAVRKFNQMAEVVTGYAKDEVVGRKWVEVVDARDAMPGFWRGFARLAKGGLPRVVEGAVVTKTGERRMISWVNSELREDGRLVGVMLFGTDITERRKAEEDLRRAHAELEKRVEQRTADLARTVKVLEEQIRVRQKAEAELLASRGALRALSARLESAREEERKNLSREVHDEFGQTLTAMKVEISWMNKRLGPGDAALSEKIKSLSDLIDRSIKVVRRMATDLRPGQLDDLGLVSALDWLVKDFQGRTKVACRLAVRPENISVDPETSTALFRIVQEALTNVMRHAKASNVTVDLDVGERALLRVKDDGRGITDKEASHPGSLGLLGIRERVLLCGGTFEIKGSPKKGTLLEVVLPLKSRGKRGGGKK